MGKACPATSNQRDGLTRTLKRYYRILNQKEINHVEQRRCIAGISGSIAS